MTPGGSITKMQEPKAVKWGQVKVPEMLKCSTEAQEDVCVHAYKTHMPQSVTYLCSSHPVLQPNQITNIYANLDTETKVKIKTQHCHHLFYC